MRCIHIKDDGAQCKSNAQKGADLCYWHKDAAPNGQTSESVKAEPSQGVRKPKAPDWLIDNIAEASKNARSIYFLYIGFLAYSALTVVSTTDRQIILNSKARLPIVNLDVSLDGFFIFAPLLAIFIFAYFQLYLHRLKGLTDDLRNNYAKTENRRLYPWMLNIAEDPEPGIIGKLQQTVVNISLWWLLPLVLMLFPLWFIKKHDLILCSIVGILPLIGTVFTVWFWVKYENVKPQSRWKLIEKVKVRPLIMVLSFEVIYFLLMLPFAFWGNAPIFRNWLYVDLSYQKLVEEQTVEYDTHYWLDLSNRNLAGANLTGSILRKTDFLNTNLRSAILTDANLQNCRLRFTDLENAILRHADLSYANLRHADLSYADLLNADLKNASLSSAILTRANLRFANMKNASLSSADLSYADLFSVDLSYARLEHSDLSNAYLEYARLIKTNLSFATLKNTELRDARFDSIDFRVIFSTNVKQLSEAASLYRSTGYTPLVCDSLWTLFPHLFEVFDSTKLDQTKYITR